MLLWRKKMAKKKYKDLVKSTSSEENKMATKYLV